MYVATRNIHIPSIICQKKSAYLAFKNCWQYPINGLGGKGAELNERENPPLLHLGNGPGPKFVCEFVIPIGDFQTLCGVEGLLPVVCKGYFLGG